MDTSKLLWLAVGGLAGYAASRSSQQRTQQRTLEIQCREAQLDTQTVASALLGACRACDRLTPVLEPLSVGRTPPLTTILDTFRSPLR